MERSISHSPHGRRYSLIGAATLVVLLFTGCASSGPPPSTQMAEARSSVRQASELGASEYAALEYRRAQRKLDEAQAALARGRHDDARRLAEQAAVDAELASVKARSAKTSEAARELQQSIQQLRQEMERERR